MGGSKDRKKKQRKDRELGDAPQGTSSSIHSAFLKADPPGGGDHRGAQSSNATAMDKNAFLKADPPSGVGREGRGLQSSNGTAPKNAFIKADPPSGVGHDGRGRQSSPGTAAEKNALIRADPPSSCASKGGSYAEATAPSKWWSFRRYVAWLRGTKKFKQTILVETPRTASRINEFHILDSLKEDSGCTAIVPSHFRHCFLMTMKDDDAKKKMLAEGIRIGSSNLALTSLNSHLAELRVHWVPLEVPDDELVKMLALRGAKSHKVEKEVNSSSKGDIYLGVRKVSVELQEGTEVDSICGPVQWNLMEFLIKADGVYEPCDKCEAKDHTTLFCKKQACTECGEEGHGWRTCKLTRRMRKQKKQQGKQAFPTLQEIRTLKKEDEEKAASKGPEDAEEEKAASKGPENTEEEKVASKGPEDAKEEKVAPQGPEDGEMQVDLRQSGKPAPPSSEDKAKEPEPAEPRAKKQRGEDEYPPKELTDRLLPLDAAELAKFIRIYPEVSGNRNCWRIDPVDRSYHNYCDCRFNE